MTHAAARTRWLVVAACATLGALAVTACRSTAGGVATAAPTAVRAEESWFGAYLQGRKIGYMSEAVRPVERDGQPRVEYSSTNYAVLDVLGQRMEQTSAYVSLCDAEFRPLQLDFTLRSAGRSQAVSATFTATQITCQKTSEGHTTTTSVPIPEGVKLVVDAQAVIAEGGLKIGDSTQVHQFNPVSLEVEACTLTAVRREPLALPGETVGALVMKMDTPMVQAEAWIDDQGRLLQLVSPMMQGKLEFKRETEDSATADLTEAGPRIDLVVATSIVPDQPILDAPRTSRLVLRVEGLGRLKQVPSDGWQRVEPLPDGSHRVTIDAAAGPPAAPRKLPLTVAAELQPYLAANPYLEADHPEMKAAAQQVLAGETDVATAIGKLRDWVNGRIRWQSNIGLFRSGLEVLRDPSGVCRDSAALYTALARAAGIPTRVCAGLVYVNGAFLGHAWAESWCGQWLPVDATLRGRFVNATHLKLAQGDKYTCVFEMLPALGSLQIQVLDQAVLPPEAP